MGGNPCAMKQKDIPCLAESTLLRGTLTPSFIDTPWPNALGRRECEALMDWTWEGAGDWEHGEGAEELLVCGGPFAQADCNGSCIGVLADAVEPLLILQDKNIRGRITMQVRGEMVYGIEKGKTGGRRNSGEQTF